MSTPALAARPRLGIARTSGLFLLLLVAVWADPLLLRRNFGGRDLFGYHLPIEFVIHDAYSRGRLPVWNTTIGGGRPLLANPNAGALYPGRPLLSGIRFPVAIKVFTILHWALAGAAVIALLRRLNVSPPGAWIGAVTYVFSGVVMTMVFYTNLIPGVMLLPWILWALAHPFRLWGTRAVLLGVLFGLDFLAGDIFTISIALGAALLWILLEVPAPERRGMAATLGIGVGLGGLLAVPQIVAAMLWVPETNRGVLGMRLWEVLLYSVSPFRLLELVVPYPFGETWTLDFERIWGTAVFKERTVGFYSGLYAGAVAVVALVELGKRRPPGARFARGLFLVALLVTVPGSLLPPRWAGLPSFLPLRYPEKFSVAMALALALYSAVALDEFRKSPRARRWMLAVGGLLALTALALRLFPEQAGRLAIAIIGGREEKVEVARAVLPGAFAEAGLLWMATAIALDLLSRGRRLALGISVVLLTAVPIAANRRIAQTFREEEIFGPTPLARYVSRHDPAGAFRTIGATRFRAASKLEKEQSETDRAQLDFCRRTWIEYTHALWRRETVFNDDFDTGDLSRLETLRRMTFRASTFLDAGSFFGALALKWSVRYRDQEPMPGFHRLRGDGLMDWEEHENPYPDIRLLTSWIEETGGLAAVNDVPRLKPGQMVIESGGSRREGSARPGLLRIVEKSPERLRLETDGADASWLFVLRGFWNHRRVLLDGQPVEYFPAQIAFSAIRVPPGRHSIDWRELVPGGSVSIWGPVFFLPAAAGLLLARRKGRAR